MKLIDITGQRFGRLTVIKRADSRTWYCKCDCGNITKADSYQLRHGITKSCGCFHRELCGDKHRKHGMTRTRLYRIFYKMHERCYRTTNDNYKYYGGLGVKVCDEWFHNFENFKEWSLQNGYNDELTLDRINPAGNYEPSNCRWATWKQQCENRRKRGTVLCQ